MKNEDIGRLAAQKLRDEFDLGVAPIDSLVHLLEHRMNIGVAFVQTDARGHGLTMQRGEQTMIAVGCTEHPMRLRSTLAHEIGHLRLNSVTGSATNSGWDERSREEIQADAFARHLLLPLEAVTDRCGGRPLSLAVLSELVQCFGASPKIVSIQLREVSLLSREDAEVWGSYSTRAIAQRFGWYIQYQALASEAMMPRGPQALFSRAICGYEWGLVSAAALARLNGSGNAHEMAQQLEKVGIIPRDFPDIVASRPSESGEGLTEEELRLLSETAD